MPHWFPTLSSPSWGNTWEIPQLDGWVNYSGSATLWDFWITDWFKPSLHCFTYNRVSHLTSNPPVQWTVFHCSLNHVSILNKDLSLVHFLTGFQRIRKPLVFNGKAERYIFQLSILSRLFFVSGLCFEDPLLYVELFGKPLAYRPMREGKERNNIVIYGYRAVVVDDLYFSYNRKMNG